MQTHQPKGAGQVPQVEGETLGVSREPGGFRESSFSARPVENNKVVGPVLPDLGAF